MCCVRHERQDRERKAAHFKRWDRTRPDVYSGVASVFITGSADGLGLLAAQQLLAQGHSVTLHARSEERARAAQRAAPRAAAVVIADVTSLEGMRSTARQANALGRFDAVIHNVGIGYGEPRRDETVDGL